jgi:magnesium chelatase subunit I
MNGTYSDETRAAAEEIQSARSQLPKVKLPDKVAKPAIKLIHKLGIDSLRAEIAWFETARAYTAADGRIKVTPEDLRVVAPMTLRLRRSAFMAEYFNNQEGEEVELTTLLDNIGNRNP